jgi:hypothetical protein
MVLGVASAHGNDLFRGSMRRAARARLVVLSEAWTQRVEVSPGLSFTRGRGCSPGSSDGLPALPDQGDGEYQASQGEAGDQRR